MQKVLWRALAVLVILSAYDKSMFDKTELRRADISEWAMLFVLRFIASGSLFIFSNIVNLKSYQDLFSNEAAHASLLDVSKGPSQFLGLGYDADAYADHSANQASKDSALSFEALPNELIEHIASFDPVVASSMTRVSKRFRQIAMEQHQYNTALDYLYRLLRFERPASPRFFSMSDKQHQPLEWRREMQTDLQVIEILSKQMKIYLAQIVTVYSGVHDEDIDLRLKQLNFCLQSMRLRLTPVLQQTILGTFFSMIDFMHAHAMMKLNEDYNWSALSVLHNQLQGKRCVINSTIPGFNRSPGQLNQHILQHFKKYERFANKARPIPPNLKPYTDLDSFGQVLFEKMPHYKAKDCSINMILQMIAIHKSQLALLDEKLEFIHADITEDDLHDSLHLV